MYDSNLSLLPALLTVKISALEEPIPTGSIELALSEALSKATTLCQRSIEHVPEATLQSQWFSLLDVLVGPYST